MSTIKVNDVARQQAAKMLSIINTEMPTVINNLNGAGQQLSDPNNWDGPLASQFRGVWPQAKGQLDKMKAELVQLQAQVQKILANISAAGGA